MQSPIGQALYRHYGLDTADPESSLLLEGGRLYLKADGGMRIVRRLGFPWSLLVAGRILPRFLADWIYDRIARNRYAWFGRREQCFVPAPEDADRFLI